MTTIETDGHRFIRTSAGTYPRGSGIVRITGPGRQRLLGTVVARSTEYAMPGEVLESLALDDDGHPVDHVVLIVDEDSTLLITEGSPGLAADLPEIARSVGVDDVGVEVLDGWHAAAIEGPRSWRAVADLLDEEIAGLLLGEWRRITIPVGAGTALLARTGTTAEYGYLIVAECDQSTLEQWAVALSEAVGGGACDDAALRRARIEVNHPVLDGQFAGISLREAGAAWMAGAGRSDDFRGKAALDVVPDRRLVAVTSAEELVPGGELRAGAVLVGRVHLVAPRPDGSDPLALALLHAPFDVPGLTLQAESGAVRTISRPTVDPVSWREPIE